MATNVSIIDTLNITKPDGSAFAGTLVEENLRPILAKEIPLFKTGILTLGAGDNAVHGGTYVFPLASLPMISDADDSDAGEKLQGSKVYLKMNRQGKIKVNSKVFDEVLFNKFGQLKGEVLGKRLVLLMKAESASFYLSLANFLKQEKADAKGHDSIVISADADIPENDRSALMASKLEDLSASIIDLWDKYTAGNIASNVFIFCKRSVFKKLRYGVAGQGHVIVDIKSENEMLAFSLNGVSVFIDDVLGKSHLAGKFHKTKAYDLSKISAVAIERNSVFHKIAKIDIYADRYPGTSKHVDLMEWIGGTTFAKQYTARTTALVSSDL